MSEYFPIEIRNLDKLDSTIVGTDVFPLQIGDNINGFETTAAQMSDVLNYVNTINQDTSINTLNVAESAVVGGLLYVGNVNPIPGINLYVDGNVVISGSLSALSGVTFFQTNVAQTTSLLLSAASGANLKVIQDFEFPIAQFFDSQNIALHVDGSSERAGNVGIKTTNPNEALTVVGHISSSNTVYGLHANTQTAYISSLSAYNLSIIGSAFLESETGSNLTIGNLISSKTTINGDVLINSVTSNSNFKTILGSDTSDVYINGYLFTNDLSSKGNLYLNTLENQNYEFNLGNTNAVNNITGTTILSGNVYLKGNVNLNVTDNSNTLINSTDNSGSVFIGNSLNTVNINANKLTHNSNLTSELINLTFTEYDSLTSTVETIFNDLSIVYFVSSINNINPTITSVQYKFVENVEGLYIDLTQDTARFGRNNFATDIRGNTINSTAGSLLSLYTLSGGIVKVGQSNNTLEIEGFNVRINDSPDGEDKTTAISSEDGSGNIEIGNPVNYTIVNGLSTYVNTLCAANTVIGSLSGSVEVYNLTVYNKLSAIVDTFNISNINTQNLISNGSSNLNNVNIAGNLNTVGNVFFSNNLGIGAQSQEKLTINGGLSATGKVYSEGGNSDVWNKPNINIVLPVTDEVGIISVGFGKIRFVSPQTFLLTKVKLGVNEPATGSSIIATLSSITNDETITSLTLPPDNFVISDTTLSYLVNEDDRLTLNIDDVGFPFNGAGLKLYLTGKYV